MFSRSNKATCQLSGLRHWQVACRYQKIVYDKHFLYFNPFCLPNFINHFTLIFRIFTIKNFNCSQYKIPTWSPANQDLQTSSYILLLPSLQRYILFLHSLVPNSLFWYLGPYLDPPNLHPFLFSKPVRSLVVSLSVLSDLDLMRLDFMWCSSWGVRAPHFHRPF